ncbi:SH3 domain-containing protein [Ceratobasidium sp. AG-Ba]|nr:SH3 domain-containing protein [Ceratobasidium sp. AG-Ba]
MGPPIQIFLTSIASAPALRQRQEHILRILQVKKIPFTSYDVASDEEAKKTWRRKAPNNASLPGILIGGVFAGTYAEFDEAVEFGELDQFFRLKEAWGEEDEALMATPAPQKPIGVPGVATPLQVTGQKPSLSPSPSKPPKKPSGKSIDLGSELSGFGLEGVKLSEEDMLELVESLGLGGDDAGDLVKGLGLSAKPQPLKAKFEAAANASASPQTTTKTPGPTDGTAKPESSVATAASIPSNQTPEANPAPDVSVSDTAPLATASTEPERATVVKEQTGKPEDRPNPEIAQPAQSKVASAVAPTDDAHLSSAADDNKAATAGVSEAGTTAGGSAQTDSQIK